jgi:hypothetical protein
MKGFATMARSDGGEDEENSCEEKDRLHTTAPETLQQRQRRQRRQQGGPEASSSESCFWFLALGEAAQIWSSLRGGNRLLLVAAVVLSITIYALWTMASLEIAQNLPSANGNESPLQSNPPTRRRRILSSALQYQNLHYTAAASSTKNEERYAEVAALAASVSVISVYKRLPHNNNNPGGAAAAAAAVATTTTAAAAGDFSYSPMTMQFLNEAYGGGRQRNSRPRDGDESSKTSQPPAVSSLPDNIIVLHGRDLNTLIKQASSSSGGGGSGAFINTGLAAVCSRYGLPSPPRTGFMRILTARLDNDNDALFSNYYPEDWISPSSSSSSSSSSSNRKKNKKGFDSLLATQYYRSFPPHPKPKPPPHRYAKDRHSWGKDLDAVIAEARKPPPPMLPAAPPVKKVVVAADIPNPKVTTETLQHWLSSSSSSSSSSSVSSSSLTLSSSSSSSSRPPPSEEKKEGGHVAWLAFAAFTFVIFYLLP